MADILPGLARDVEFGAGVILLTLVVIVGPLVIGRALLTWVRRKS